MISVNKYSQNIQRNYWFEFFIGLNFTQVIWVTYFAFKGLSFVEIGLAESFFHVSSLIMEIPTGIIADIYGRKISRLLGVIVKILYLIMLIFVKSFPMAAFAMFLAALSYNLDSGADTALVYDTLVEINQVDSFSKIQGKREVILQISSLLGIFIGGLLADYNYTIAIFGAILMFIIAYLIGMSLHEPNIKTIEKKISLNQHLKSSYKEIIQQPKLIVIMIFGAIILSSLVTAHYYVSLYWINQGFTLSIISIWFMIQSGGSILGGIIVSRLIKSHHVNWIKGISLFIAICLWLIVNPDFGIISLFLLGFMESLLYVTLMHIINDAINSEQRATILSINSMFFSFIMIIIFPLFGYIGDIANLVLAFNLLAGFTTIIAILILFINVKLT